MLRFIKNTEPDQKGNRYKWNLEESICKGHDSFFFFLMSLNLWTCSLFFLKWIFSPLYSWWTPCHSSWFSSSLTSFLKSCLSFSPSQRGLVISSLFSVSFHSYSNIYYAFTMRQFLCSYSLPHLLKTRVPEDSVLSPFPHFTLFLSFSSFLSHFSLGPSHSPAWLQQVIWYDIGWYDNILAWYLVHKFVRMFGRHFKINMFKTQLTIFSTLHLPSSSVPYPSAWHCCQPRCLAQKSGNSDSFLLLSLNI